MSKSKNIKVIQYNNVMDHHFPETKFDRPQN